MNEAVIRYLVGVVLCAVVAVAYSATRRKGLRAVALYSLFCFGCMMGVILGVAAVVLAVCSLK